MKMMTIASGSSGNCTYVGSENTGILVDVGVSKKKILDALQDVDRTFADINGIVNTWSRCNIKSVWHSNLCDRSDNRRNQIHNEPWNA